MVASGVPPRLSMRGHNDHGNVLLRRAVNQKVTAAKARAKENSNRPDFRFPLYGPFGGGDFLLALHCLNDFCRNSTRPR